MDDLLHTIWEPTDWITSVDFWVLMVYVLITNYREGAYELLDPKDPSY